MNLIGSAIVFYWLIEHIHTLGYVQTVRSVSNFLQIETSGLQLDSLIVDQSIKLVAKQIF